MFDKTLADPEQFSRLRLESRALDALPARELLKRFAHRHEEAGATVFVPALFRSDSFRPAAVPSALVLTTVQAAVTYVGARMSAAKTGFLSASVRDLLKKTLRSLRPSRWNWWFIVFLLVFNSHQATPAVTRVQTESVRCEGCQGVRIIHSANLHSRVHLRSHGPSHLFDR
jgi:hypothetical protein